MILAKCATCGNKKIQIYQKSRSKKILSSLDLRTPISKVTL